MSGNTIDNKVVSLKFDNSQFASKVTETQSMLERLKSKLNFSGSTQGLNELDQAAKNFSMAPMATSIEGINAKFAAMATIAITALSSIVTKAIDVGAQITKSLTIDPVTSGFSEYETNMNSIQTILANTKADGSTLDDVNSALDTLNQYSDQTIYNFSEMARNIGTFTAAGVNLDDSVNAIKGIANLAAISGSNSGQASTAMYQLSQALAAGKVNLMDWNSVVNAGMGGKVFKDALFETGKAMGEITDVPLGATFEEWEAKGGTFRDQMQKGWLTADVLKTTLGAFSGDLDKATLRSIGFSDAAANKMIELGTLGQKAATEVKTATQLIGTVKEAIGSGWSTSFRLILGNFEEAKVLFTSINDFVGGIVKKSAESRNEMLLQWKDFGGRNALIEGMMRLVESIGSILSPIKEAFRDIFPKKTAADLLVMTDRFRSFAESLKLTPKAAGNVAHIFSGIFSLFKIGIEVVKGIAGVFKDVFVALKDGAGGPAVGFLNRLASSIIGMRESLVDEGGIADFFDNIGEKAAALVGKILEVAGAIGSVFGSGASAGAEGTLSAFDRIRSAVGDIVDWFREHFGSMQDIIAGFAEFLRPVLDGLADVIDAFRDNLTADGAASLINAGIFAAVLLAVRSVIKRLDSLVEAGEGFVEGIQDIIGGVTDTLKAMQLKLKAEALMKIAIAIAVLAAGILVLSLIDPVALTKAMTAVGVGMGQLVAAMALLTKVDATGFKIGAIALALIGMSVALLVFAAAVKVMSTMDQDELMRGLGGIAAGMLILIGAVRLLSADPAGLLAGAAAMVVMSLALIVLAQAVEAFGSMEWEVLKQGLTGAGVALAGLVAATWLMSTNPAGLIAGAAAMILMGLALKVVASAVQEFGEMEWEVMKQGLIGAGLALAGIALATNLMPPNMLLTGIGLIAIAAGLKIISGVLQELGEMGWDELKQGMTAIAVTLGILALAANAMSGAILGAGAILILAFALKPMADVLEQLGNMSLGQVGIALLALAGALVVLGLAAVGATYIAPALILLAASLLAIGAGVVLLGGGLYLAARALEIFGAAAPEAAQAVARMLIAIAEVLPELAGNIGLFVLRLIEVILEGLPPVLAALGEVLSALADVLIAFIPQLGEIINLLVQEILQIIIENTPALVEAGYGIVMSLLRGLDENIEEITERAISIITKFLETMSENMDDIVAAGVEFIVSFLDAIAGQADTITESAVAMILSFIAAISEQIDPIIQAGADLLVDFLKGISDNITTVSDAALAVILKFIDKFTQDAQTIIDAGFDALLAFLKGITDNLLEVSNAALAIILTFIAEITKNGLAIAGAGADAIIAFIRGIASNFLRVIEAGTKTVLKFLEGVSNAALTFTSEAAKLLIKFLNALALAIEIYAPEIRAAGGRVAAAIIDGITGGLLSKASEVGQAAADVAQEAYDAAVELFTRAAPTKGFKTLGESMDADLAAGLLSGGAAHNAGVMAAQTVEAFLAAIKSVDDKTTNLEGIYPTITPILDLSEVESKASRLNDMFALAPIRPDVSFDQARYILHTNDRKDDTSGSTDGGTTTSTELTYNQTIISPKPLRANDVYRGTKSLLAKTKEELGI